MIVQDPSVIRFHFCERSFGLSISCLFIPLVRAEFRSTRLNSACNALNFVVEINNLIS